MAGKGSESFKMNPGNSKGLVGFETKVSGSLFNGELQKHLAHTVQDLEDDWGVDAVKMIQNQLDTVLQHPTGHYRSSIHAVRDNLNEVVTDGGIIYGPWLEGVSSRNDKTRFKGYATFRKVAQRLNELAKTKAEAAMKRFTEKENS